MEAFKISTTGATGAIEHWNIGTLEHWNIGTTKGATFFYIKVFTYIILTRGNHIKVFT